VSSKGRLSGLEERRHYRVRVGAAPSYPSIGAKHLSGKTTTKRLSQYIYPNGGVYKHRKRVCVRE